MATQRQAVNMGFTEETFPQGTHMCLIYNDDAERRRIIGRFLESGLESGEHVSYFADTPELGDVKSWLKEMGLSLSSGQDQERFALSEAMHTYCPHGHFDPKELLDGFDCFCQQTMARSYTGIRMTGEMTWALNGLPGSNRLMEYEAQVTEFCSTRPIVSICQYDAKRFDGATILKALMVHPMMVVHGQIVRNPYFMKPSEFLKRHAHAGDA